MREPIVDLTGSRVLVAVVEHDSIGSERRERGVGVSPVVRSKVAVDHLGQIDVDHLSCLRRVTESVEDHVEQPVALIL
jgi:hypothetical protein